MNDNPDSFGSKLELIKASNIKLKQVRWLWYPYIPFGKVTGIIECKDLRCPVCQAVHSAGSGKGR